MQKGLLGALEVSWEDRDTHGLLEFYIKASHKSSLKGTILSYNKQKCCGELVRDV